MPPLPEDASRLVALARTRMLPWWAEQVDVRCGGYRLSPVEKQLATQSRMAWAFSRAHYRGLGDYVAAAARGIEFVLERFRDRRHGGFVWKTDVEGRVLSDRKILVGQLFVIYALVEYFRASGERAALDEALALFELLENRAHDDAHGGWLEHFRRSWRPIRRVRRWTRGVEVEIPGLKSANVHMHAFEALAELYAVTGDAGVGDALAETVDLTQAHFYPAEPEATVQHRRPDWSPTSRARSGISIGHNSEFAWLLLRAEESLGRERSWDVLERYVEHALAAPPAARIWWEQAELLAALATLAAARPEPRLTAALDDFVRFLLAYQLDEDGVWVHTVAADGRPLDTTRVSTWKDVYHELRATVALAESCGISSGQAWSSPSSRSRSGPGAGGPSAGS